MVLFTGSIFLDLIGIIVAIFAIIYSYFQWTYQTWKKKNIPYFEPKFPYGNLEPLNKQLSQNENMFNIVKRAKREGWDYFGIFLGGKSLFVPLDLEILKCIMTKDFNHFTDRGVFYNEKDDPLSAHLFNIGGTKWKNLRKKLTPAFSSTKLKGMFQTVVDCSSFLEEFLKEHDSREPIDIKYTLNCFTIDVIGSCAFGLECNSFKNPCSPFVKNGRRIFDLTTLEQIKTLFTMTFPNLARTLHLRRLPKEVANFYYNIVSETVNHREKNNYSRKDLLQLLIDIKNNKEKEVENNKGEESITIDEMVAQCFLFFVAGFETSSTTMIFALYHLAIHPQFQEKVREELFRVLKKYDNKICYDSINELEYMQQVLDESLRKDPPAETITRQCTEDYKIPNSNIILEKGTNILIPIKNIHYYEDIYENPETFDPERFSPEMKSKRHQYAHIPFGEGPRICIGMRFGLMESKVGLATILRNVRVTLNPKTKTPLEYEPKSIITSIKGGLWLNLEKINDSKI